MNRLFEKHALLCIECKKLSGKEAGLVRHGFQNGMKATVEEVLRILNNKVYIKQKYPLFESTYDRVKVTISEVDDEKAK